MSFRNAVRVVCTIALLGASVFGQQLDRTLTITIGAERLTKTPIDKRIYGVMLEHLRERVNVLWAELLQDASFEAQQERLPQSEHWPELHPWRSFGTNKAASVRTVFAYNIMNGMHAKVIWNRSEHPVGIAQDGVPVRAGISYHFEGYLKPSGRNLHPNPAQVTIGLYADPALQKPYAEATLAVRTANFEKYTGVLTVPETNENATFALAVEPNSSVAVDFVSLMPADNLSGWRADVVAAIKYLGVTSFRYPGGCFTSFVDWETMVGPPELRLPFTNRYWGGLEPNRLGTDEFLRLMEIVGGEPLLVANLISGSPERAAGWVEYCNGNERTHYGRMRARNGHPKPYGVKYWELDQEVWRRFSAVQYAEQCRLYAKAMRAVDPTIQLLAMACWNDEELSLLVERVAPFIDFMAVRTVDKNELAKLQAVADRYSRPDHRLLIASTEWYNKFRKVPWTRFDEKLRGLRGQALESARSFQEFQRRSDHVRMAMLPSLSSDKDRGPLNVGKAGIVYTPNGRVFKLMSDIRGRVVRTAVKGGTGKEKLDVNAVVDEDAKRLVCTLVHGDGVEILVRVDLRAWKQTRPSGTIIWLSSGDLENLLDFRGPESVPQKEMSITGDGGVFTIAVPPYSVSKVVIALE